MNEICYSCRYYIRGKCGCWNKKLQCPKEQRKHIPNSLTNQSIKKGALIE